MVPDIGTGTGARGTKRKISGHVVPSAAVASSFYTSAEQQQQQPTATTIPPIQACTAQPVAAVINRGAQSQSPPTLMSMPKTPTKQRIEYVIDLCTPSPAVNKISDPLNLASGDGRTGDDVYVSGSGLGPGSSNGTHHGTTKSGKRIPLAVVPVPNYLLSTVSSPVSSFTQKQQQQQQQRPNEKSEKASYEGYLSLCRLTRQASASQRSFTTTNTTTTNANVIDRDDCDENDDDAAPSVSQVPLAFPLPLTSPLYLLEPTTTNPAAAPTIFQTEPPSNPETNNEFSNPHEHNVQIQVPEMEETEETKRARLAGWKSRNARVVVARSRWSVNARRVAAGKGFIGWRVVPGRGGAGAGAGEAQVAVVAEDDCRSSSYMEGDIDSTYQQQQENQLHQQQKHQQPVTPTDTLHHTRTRYLEQFVSHQHADTYRVDPNPDHAGFRRREWSPVYACAYTNSAKRGGDDGPKILALASESGTIKLIDTRSASTSASSHSSSGSGSAFASAANTTMQFYPHQNAIFDLAWDQADERLLTASGDQLGAVHRLGQAGEVRREAVLVGHTSSVKTCTWYDDNVVLTAGRDGNIHMYDLRCTGVFSSDLGIEESRYNRGRASYGAFWDQARLSPVMSVRNAHGVGGGCGRKVTSRSAVRSVTSLLALNTDRNKIASGGSADGVVKFWDIRANLASPRRIYVSEPVAETLDRTADRGRRSRGVISLGEAAGKVYALCNDARIHPHSISSPHLALPTYYTHPALTEPSFYLKLAVSPCEAFLACGTSGGKFAMWNVQRDYLGAWPSGRSSVLEQGSLAGDTLGPVNAIQGIECGFGAGHTRQIGSLAWAADQIATCSDDYSSRLWNPSPVVVKAMREKTVGYEYWAGTVNV